MRLSYLLRVPLAVVVILATGSCFAQPAIDVPTLVKGLQQRREHFKHIAGRIVVGRKALTADKPEPQPSLTLVDFARNDSGYRIEQREVIVPTQRWYLYGIIEDPNRAGKPVEPWQLYQSLVCDGKMICHYDRSINRCVITPIADPSQAASMERTQVAAERIDSSATRAFGDMVGEMTEKWLLDVAVTKSVQGIDTVEGHSCYRISALSEWSKGEGTENGRTFYRLWISPDLDYGVVRTEQVRVLEKRGLNSCIVQRASGWTKDDSMDLWVPERYQMDWFSWHGVKEMGLPGPGWHQTMAIARMALTNRSEDVAAALPLKYPFDCATLRRTSEQTYDRTDDPSLYPSELTPLLAYQPPDAFGTQLTPTTDIKALFENQ